MYIFVHTVSKQNVNEQKHHPNFQKETCAAHQNSILAWSASVFSFAHLASRNCLNLLTRSEDGKRFVLKARQVDLLKYSILLTDYHKSLNDFRLMCNFV